jgi:hypothetical protein
MTGVGLDINGNEFDFNFSKIEGNDCHIQNVTVVVGTKKGTDKVFVNKGTDLDVFFIGKNYINNTRAQHLANFAALDAYNFYRQYNSQTFRLMRVNIDASSLFLNSPKLKVNVIISENPENFRI